MCLQLEPFLSLLVRPTDTIFTGDGEFTRIDIRGDQAWNGLVPGANLSEFSSCVTRTLTELWWVPGIYEYHILGSTT